jgi:hypothetical protein
MFLSAQIFLHVQDCYLRRLPLRDFHHMAQANASGLLHPDAHAYGGAESLYSYAALRLAEPSRSSAVSDLSSSAGDAANKIKECSPGQQGDKSDGSSEPPHKIAKESRQSGTKSLVLSAAK